LKENLKKAQDRIKRFADKKRSERKFIFRDWMYLKLQPYRQFSIQSNTDTHKLKPMFYGPFKIP
jgi:hypothetical protein